MRARRIIKTSFVVTSLLLPLYLLLWISSRWQHVLHVAGDYLIFAAVTLTLPVLYFLYRSIRRDVQRKQVDYSPLFLVIVFIIGMPMMIFTWGYTLVITLNAVLPPQTPLIYEGQVLAKDEVKGRSTDYYLILDGVDDYGFELRLKVSRHQYRGVEIGEHYQQEMLRGGLGIDYRLGW